jgi:hypothetical protein
MHRIKSPFKILFLLALFTLAVFFMNSCGGVGGGGSGGGCEDSGSCLSVTYINIPTNGNVNDGSDIDVYRHWCWDDKDTLSDPTDDTCEPEAGGLYYKTTIEVEIQNDDLLPGSATLVTMTGYSVSFTQHPDRCYGVVGPNLSSFSGYLSGTITPNGSTTFSDIKLVAPATKASLGSYGAGPWCYTAHYTFRGEDWYGNDVSCKADINFQLGDYSYCDADTWIVAACPDIPSDLLISPDSTTVAPAGSATYIITGGTPPYTVFTSNPGETSFTAPAAGDTITVNASGDSFTIADDAPAATADTTVTITALDSLGLTDTAEFKIDVP